MVAFEGSGQCRETVFYYCNFLQDRESVPKSVAEHIESCAYCQAQVQQLRMVIGESAIVGNPHRLSHSRELITELQSHLELAGKSVTCTHVRRYLPGLLADRIRIPTPITVHVDQCDRCAEDIEHLRSLGLTQEQLTRLAEVYAKPVHVDLSLCRQVKLLLTHPDNARLEDFPAHLIDHIASCPQCRERTHEARQELLDEARQNPVVDPYVRCGRIMSCDIFDLVIPSAAGASEAATADRHRVVAGHVFSCPECLEKVQSMHRVIFGIAERAESGIATIYSTVGIAEPASKKKRHSYASYPIDVRVLGGRLKTRQRPRKTNTLIAAFKRRLLGRRLKAYVPVSAVVIIVAALVGIYIFSSQAASGLSLGQLRHMQPKVSNIHILRYVRYGGLVDPGSTRERQLLQEEWVSTDLQWYVTVSPGGTTSLRDMKNRRIRTWSPGDLQIKTTDMPTSRYSGFKDSMQKLTEFDFGYFPDKSELQPCQSGSADASGVREEVYEVLSRQADEAAGAPGESRMVFYVDRITHRLERTEFSRKNPESQDWGMENVVVYQYPSTEEVEEHFQQFIPVK
jgi:hypothetical protein